MASPYPAWFVVLFVAGGFATNAAGTVAASSMPRSLSHFDDCSVTCSGNTCNAFAMYGVSCDELEDVTFAACVWPVCAIRPNQGKIFERKEESTLARCARRRSVRLLYVVVIRRAGVCRDRRAMFVRLRLLAAPASLFSLSRARLSLSPLLVNAKDALWDLSLSLLGRMSAD